MCVAEMGKIFDKMEKIDPLAHDLAENLVTTESKLIKGGAKMVGADMVADEAQYNADHPGEGLAKASITAGSIMAPQLYGAGGAGAGAADTLSSGAAAAGDLTAQQMAQIAMQEMADPSLYASGQGLLTPALQNVPSSIAADSGILSPLQEGVSQSRGILSQYGNKTMESALADTGYTPHSLYNALSTNASTFNPATGALDSTSLSQNLANYGNQLKVDALNGSTLNRMGSNMGDKNSMALMKMGTGLLDQPQQPPPPPPPRQQGSTEPMPLPYDRVPKGMSSNMDPRFMTEEQKRRLRAMGVKL
jgi:hypothetical protein